MGGGQDGNISREADIQYVYIQWVYLKLSHIHAL